MGSWKEQASKNLLSLHPHYAHSICCFQPLCTNADTPANGPAPVERSTYFGYPVDLTGVDIRPRPFPVPTDGRAGRHVVPPTRRAPHALTQCPNDIHRYTLDPDFSNTTCQFVIYERGNPDPFPCTAWFTSRDGDGYMMVTAGHCVANGGSRQYFIDPAAPNQVCCNYDAAGTCIGGLFDVRAWVTTQGWYTSGTNDGAVIWVQQVPQFASGLAVPQITPVLQPITYNPFNANLPATTLFSDGYPANSTKPDGTSSDEGCDFATGKELWSWSVPTPVSPINTNTQQGRDVTYQVPGCAGHSGGRLLNTDMNAFAILVRGPTGCPTNGVSDTTFTQIVNQRGPYGAHIAAMQQAVQASVQGLQWVEPAAGQSCEAACTALGWRFINGGSNLTDPLSSSALCAGFVDLPSGLGSQWLSGKHYAVKKGCFGYTCILYFAIATDMFMIFAAVSPAHVAPAAAGGAVQGAPHPRRLSATSRVPPAPALLCLRVACTTTCTSPPLAPTCMNWKECHRRSHLWE